MVFLAHLGLRGVGCGAFSVCRVIGVIARSVFMSRTRIFGRLCVMLVFLVLGGLSLARIRGRRWGRLRRRVPKDRRSDEKRAREEGCESLQRQPRMRGRTREFT